MADEAAFGENGVGDSPGVLGESRYMYIKPCLNVSSRKVHALLVIVVF